MGTEDEQKTQTGTNFAGCNPLYENVSVNPKKGQADCLALLLMKEYLRGEPIG